MNAGRALVVVIPAVLATSLALAEQAAPPPDAKKAAAAEKKAAPAPGAPAARAAGGLVVFVDPVTGKVRQPDAAEIGELVSPPSAVTPPGEEPLAVKTGPGGAVGVVLDGRFESFLVVTKKPDGKLEMDCVTGSRKADEAVLAGAKASPKPDEKEAPHVR